MKDKGQEIAQTQEGYKKEALRVLHYISLKISQLKFMSLGNGAEL